MKAKQLNRIMYTAGILLLAGLVNYFLNSSQTLLHTFLNIATYIAGYPTFVKAEMAVRQKMFSIDILVTIAVIEH